MAGSFGYEKEHYDVSMQIGELKLFPAVAVIKFLMARAQRPYIPLVFSKKHC